VLAWIIGRGEAEAIKLAQDQRVAASFPESRKAKDLVREWRRAGLPVPPGA
jgi:hypothetical protein